MASILFLFTLFAAKIQLGNQILQVEIADTPSTRSKGLMERDELPEQSGMLFVYPKEELLSFWMKNTRIPLSIGFFDKERRLLQVIDMDISKEKEPSVIYSSYRPAKYALEVQRGWFKKYKIQLGDKFSMLN